MIKTNKFLDSKFFKVLVTAITWILTALILLFSVLTFLRASKNNFAGAAYFMVGIFISMGLAYIFGYLKDRNGSFIRALLMSLISVGLGVLVYFAKDNAYIFSISAGVFALSIIISRVLRLIHKHTSRDIIFSIIIIAIAVVSAVGFFQRVENDLLGNIILLECLFISIVAFAEALMITLSNLKLNTFFSVILRTFALEILFGLVALIVGASLILMHVEPKMSSFPDALWYCFAVVTTIGFGDFAAVTPLGRIITVILGIYGIVVVAVITSIIVNFYNETYGKRDAREVKRISKKD